MQFLLTLIFYLVAGACLASPEDLVQTHQIAKEVSLRLALSRIERLQPKLTSDTEWTDWEALRWQALRELKQPEMLLERLQAQEAIKVEDASQALSWTYLAHTFNEKKQHPISQLAGLNAIWTTAVDPQALSSLRLQIVEAQLAQRMGDEAYRSMLRYQQDKVNLNKDEAANFAVGLFTIGQDKLAATWLDLLDPKHPVFYLIEHRLSRISSLIFTQYLTSLPDDRLLQYLPLIKQQAAKAQDTRLNLWLDERFPNSTPNTKDLWSSYRQVALSLGNEAQLLTGDDAAWSALYKQWEKKDALTARAILAHQSITASTDAMRQQSAVRLLQQLVELGLTDAAFSLFGEGSQYKVQEDTQLRYQLGMLAASRKLYLLAHDYWQDLSLPAEESNMSLWSIRQAEVLLRAGKVEDIGALIRQIIKDETPIPAEQVPQALEVARLAGDSGHQELALELLDNLARRTAGDFKAKVAMVQGRLLLAKQQFVAAADAFASALLLSKDVDLKRNAQSLAETCFQIIGWPDQPYTTKSHTRTEKPTDAPSRNDITKRAKPN